MVATLHKILNVLSSQSTCFGRVQANKQSLTLARVCEASGSLYKELTRRIIYLSIKSCLENATGYLRSITTVFV